MSSLSSFLVHPMRKEVQSPKDEPYPLKIGQLRTRSSAPMGTGVLPITLDGDTLSRQLMGHNKFITITNVAHQPHSHMARAWPPALHLHHLPFLPPSNEKEKKKTWRFSRVKKEFWSKGSLEKIVIAIFISGLHSIYRWKRSWTASNSNFQLSKSQSTSQDFWSIESAKDQPSPLKHKTLLPSHYNSWIRRDAVSNPWEI